MSRPLAMFDVVSNQGPFPPPALPGFIGTMGLSDFRPGPALSLAGCRLRVNAPSPHRISRVAWLSCADMPSPLPRRNLEEPQSLGPACPDPWAPLFTTAAFPAHVPGRLPRYQFRGLLSVHSRYGLPARGTAERSCSPKASTMQLPPSPLRLLPAGATTLAGWD